MLCSSLIQITFKCIAVQYSTEQYSTVEYSTVPHSTVQYSTVQYRREVEYFHSWQFSYIYAMNRT